MGPGTFVASETPLEAVAALLPDSEITEVSDGHKWVRYRVDSDLPEKWPRQTEGSGGGNIIDLEVIGKITVVL